MHTLQIQLRPTSGQIILFIIPFLYLNFRREDTPVSQKLRFEFGENSKITLREFDR